MGVLEERIQLTAKMFANIKDNDGSEHEEVKDDIRIIFDEHITPQTDGKTIYLPTSMNEDRLWELLGALLHEALHIRFTDMDSIDREFHNDSSLFHCLNALEDMRINWKAMECFPKTKLFFHALYYYLAKSKKAELLKEPITFQIIKTLLLSNDDFPVYSEKGVELIKKYDLNRFQEIARNAESVADLQEPAKELYEILKKIAGEDLAGLGDSDLENFLKNLKEDLEKMVNGQGDTTRDLQKEYDKLNDERAKLNKEWKRLHRKMATNKTRSRNLEAEADDLDKEADEAAANGDNATANELRNKANHKRKLSDAAKYRGDEAENDLNEIEQKQIDNRQKLEQIRSLLDKARKKLDELKGQLEDLLKNGTESQVAGFGYSPVTISGLEALTKQDLCYKHEYKLPKTLEDTIREVFLRKKEDKEIDDEGNRLNRSNLYRIATDNQRLFDAPVQPWDKTKISFLIDMSGSMHGTREKLVNTAFAYLYNSLMEVLVNDNLDVEIGVFSFDSEVYTLKNFDEDKNGEQVLEEYHPRGGTCIKESLNTVIKKMDESGTNEKRIVILLTDAEVYEDELVQLKNGVNFEDTNVIFIGIEVGKWAMEQPAAKSLFMDNIEDDSDVVKILTNALVRSI